MRTFPICTANSRQAAVWSASRISYEEMCDRLRTPFRTTETVEQYHKMTKPEKDTAKDKGGFMAGSLKGTRRRKSEVVSRSIITLDADKMKPGFIEDYRMIYQRNLSLIYSTHSHTPEKPRARILIFLSRDVTPDEYNALARLTAEELGITMFDPVSFEVNQLMYWPTCPSDGEYIFEQFDGPPLDPDEFLAEHPGWRDPTTLPCVPGEEKKHDAARRKQEDPLGKIGIVGAFCRTYGIDAAIERYLADVYEASTVEGRYDYIPGEGSCGVVVYNDKFAYSHHATDPAGGKLLNAFDLVRIHRFGDDDPKQSFTSMCSLAMEDEEVRLLLAQEKASDADMDFADPDWRKRLKYNVKTGKLEDSVYNLNLILSNDTDFLGFAFNELANRIQITGKLPWERPEGNSFWREADMAQLKSVIDIRYLPFSSRNYDISFTKIADDRHFHPVREYLDGLPEWDGVKRVEDVFIKYLLADDTEYVRSVTRKSFAAAVARAYHPGVKFDCVPVLDGVQGIGKSTIVKDLVTPELYSETLSLTDMDDKSGAEKLQGFWAVEIGELAGMKKADVEKVKAFLSTCDDKYRPSYGRVVESHPRQCIIIATVNGERGYLRDITGNRRFWIIKLHQTGQKKAWNFTPEFRAQFWAEAKAILEAGEKLYLEGDILKEAEQIQQSAMEVDERVGMVEEYLSTLLPENWAEMDLYERRNFLSGNELGGKRMGTVERTEVSNVEIWAECFGRNPTELKSSDAYAIAALMSQATGWERTSIVRKIPFYGRQRLYRKDC